MGRWPKDTGRAEIQGGGQGPTPGAGGQLLLSGLGAACWAGEDRVNSAILALEKVMEESKQGWFFGAETRAQAPAFPLPGFGILNKSLKPLRTASFVIVHAGKEFLPQG